MKMPEVGDYMREGEGGFSEQQLAVGETGREVVSPFSVK